MSKLCHLYEKSRRETIMYKTNSSSVVLKNNGIIDTEWKYGYNIIACNLNYINVKGWF